MTDPPPISHPLTRIHRWLVAPEMIGEVRWSVPAAALALEHFGGGVAPLAERLARHLCEFDAPCEESWLCVDQEMVRIALGDVACQSLLRGSGGTVGSPRLLMEAIALRGHAILEISGVLAATARLDNTFRVALVPAGPLKPRGFHLAVDPLRFEPDCLIAVIGDAFLEWMYGRDRGRAHAGGES